MYKRIGIIGFGNMGAAIAEQLKNDYQIFVFDKDKGKTENCSGILAVKDSAELLSQADIIILAVKPQDFDGILNEIKGFSGNKLIISIAAGISTEYIEKTLGIVRVVRAMPNIAARTGDGVTCLSNGRFATEEDFDSTEDIFEYLGETKRIEEGLMNAATAVSGSGPGFCYDEIERRNIDTNNIDDFRRFVHEQFVPSLKSAAEGVGFSPQEAEFLSVITGNGCIGLFVKTKLPIAELKKQITSKGGTTEAGLEVLHKGGSLEEAVKAALKRAKELSRS